jgi:hypothetical protein
LRQSRNVLLSSIFFAGRDDFLPLLGLARTCWFATALVQKLNAER